MGDATLVHEYSSLEDPKNKPLGEFHFLIYRIFIIVYIQFHTASDKSIQKGAWSFLETIVISDLENVDV